MSIKQHLMALRRIRLQHEGTAGTQLQVSGHDLAPDPTDDQMLLAPVELEGLTQLKLQRDKGFDQRLASIASPAPDEFGDAAVVTAKARCLQLRMQLARCADLAWASESPSPAPW